MRSPDGGSVHDPDKSLPAPLWDRAVQGVVDDNCRRCVSDSRKKTRLHSVPAPGGGLVLVCERCDGGRSTTKT